MDFYEKLQAKAIELIDRFGREITLYQPTQNRLDSNAPWKGQAAYVAPNPPDPAQNEPNILVTKGVFVPPNQVRIFGLSALGDATEFKDLVSFSEQIIIVAGAEQVDFKSYIQVIDNEVNWGITGVQIMKPANRVLLAYFGVRR